MMNSCCGQKNANNLSGNQALVYETDSHLSTRDRVGGCRVRWGISRMNYQVSAGLYRLGKPDSNSPVLVTANYKLTFDALRKELKDLDAWILVLDTKGVNVWCAAGKGTFGTEELVGKIRSTGLDGVVTHRRLVVPQLGAPGIAAHEIKKETGFRVVYGPVYAHDIKAFLAGSMKATQAMRRVRFGLKERLRVIPMEIVPALKFIPLLFGVLVLLRLLDGSGLSAGIWTDFVPYVGALVLGSVIFQLLLPWIPGRAFAFKGWLLGIAGILLLNQIFGFAFWKGLSNLLIAPMLVSYLALNFTGASTFTSLSGVLKEVRIATPVMIGGIVAGLVVRILSRFLS